MPRSEPAKGRSRSKAKASRTAARGAAGRRPSRPARITETEAATWYQGKGFTFDWTSWHFPNWFKLLREYRRRTVQVLEIGSWEGRSALFFLNYLPRAKLTCIDTFEGGKEHQVGIDPAGYLRAVERRFDANTKEFAPRIEKLKARSSDALTRLALQGRRFDIAYIDGSHLAHDVYSDAALTWPLVARGGLVIFDDYRWTDMPDPLDLPKPGIDAFLKTIEGQHRRVLDDYQIAIVKR